MNIEEVCESRYCTNCCACLNICPTDCISLRKGVLGEMRPSIDEKRCVNCGRCKKVCPVNREVPFLTPIECYAAWTEDKDKRRKCASGGIATILSEYVINKLNGVVYGTRYNEKLNPICCRIDNINDLEYLKGSKYVQSHIGSIYKQVRNDLKKNIFVLFIGTPCQIAGLKSFINFDYENLVTCDLICHGVSPASYLEDEIIYLKKRYKINEITDCRFRGNDGKNFKFSLWKEERNEYVRNEYSQYYFSAFLKAISLHESCYNCKYARSQRISDITIGDFLGIGKTIPFHHNKTNVSVTILNTVKSILLWKNVCAENQQLISILRPYEEAVSGGISLRQPFPRHPYNIKFRKLYEQYGWTKSIRKILWKSVLMNRIITSPISYTWRIPRKIYRLLFKRNTSFL